MDPNNTHTELVHLPGLGNAFLKVPDKCDHVYEDNVHILGNGDVLYEKDYLCPTNEATWEYLQKVADEKNSFIQIGTSACIKCKKIWSPPMW